MGTHSLLSRFHLWVVVFICGWSLSYVGGGCGCGPWTWTYCGQLCHHGGCVHHFVGGLHCL